MAMVSVAYWQPKAWSRGRQPFCIVAHSSHELGELSQCFKNDDSTIKIILVLVLVAVYTRCNLDFGEIVCISERRKVCCSYRSIIDIPNLDFAHLYWISYTERRRSLRCIRLWIHPSWKRRLAVAWRYWSKNKSSLQGRCRPQHVKSSDDLTTV